MAASSTVFSMRGRGLKLDTREDMASHLKDINFDQIEEIYIGGNTFGIGASQALGEALSKMKRLRVANLSNIFISRLISEIPDALTAICDGLKNLDTLVEVNLSDNAFGGRSVHPLVPLLTENRAIQVLKLNNNGLGPEGGEVIAKALQESARISNAEGKPSKLRVLVCGRNRLEDGSAQAWGAALAAHENLTKLKMVQNGIREDGVSAIAKGLVNCHHLRYLNLRDNLCRNVGDDDEEEGEGREDAADHIAKALVSMKQLRFLDLSDCGLDAPGSLKIIRGLSGGHHTQLKTLLLENNDMGESVYEQLSNLVSRNLPSLSTLSLICNEDLDSEPVSALTATLENRGGRVLLDDEEEEPASDAEKEEEEVVEIPPAVAPAPKVPVAAEDELAEQMARLKVDGN